MLKHALLCTTLLALAAPAAAIAQPPAVAESFMFPKPDSDPRATVTPAMLREIMGWLAQSFDLPANAPAPIVAFTSPERMAALRYPGLLDRHEQRATGSSTVAVYEAATGTIHLPLSWRGASPAEMSVLVHEVVHHLQHAAKLPFACPQEREQLAYRAQDRWLARFDRSLASEFGIDGFTLLVNTNCGF